MKHHRMGIDPPPGRIGVYDTHGQRRGHVGPHAGVSVATRLLGGAPAEVGRVKGKPAWISTAPSSDERGCPSAEGQAGEVTQDG